MYFFTEGKITKNIKRKNLVVKRKTWNPVVFVFIRKLNLILIYRW